MYIVSYDDRLKLCLCFCCECICSSSFSSSFSSTGRVRMRVSCFIMLYTFRPATQYLRPLFCLLIIWLQGCSVKWSIRIKPKESHTFHYSIAKLLIHRHTGSEKLVLRNCASETPRWAGLVKVWAKWVENNLLYMNSSLLPKYDSSLFRTALLPMLKDFTSYSVHIIGLHAVPSYTTHQSRKHG